MRFLNNKSIFVKVLQWIIPLLISVITFVTFLPSLKNGFITDWDDKENFLINQNYQGLSLNNLKWMVSTFHLGVYQPLSWFILSLQYLIFKLNPKGYHLVSILIHTLNGLLFYFISLYIFKKINFFKNLPKGIVYISLGFASLFFSIHPLRVEVVSWASCQPYTLCGFFFLLSILSYLYFTSYPSINIKYWLWYWASFFFFTLSLLSKTASISLPFVFILFDFFLLKRNFPLKQIIYEKIPFLVVSMIFIFIAPLAKAEDKMLQSISSYGIEARISQAFYGILFYFIKTLIPVNLSPYYPIPKDISILNWKFLLSVIVVISISLTLIKFRKRFKFLVIIWLYYIIMLLPTLGIFNIGIYIAADRYSYLSCMGWPLIIGGIILYVYKINKNIIDILVMVIGFLCFSFGLLTWNQTKIWYNSETLWKHNISVNPNSYLGYINLGNALSNKGDVDNAISQYEKAIKISPNHPYAYINLGNLLTLKGDFYKALSTYKIALTIDYNNPDIHYNMGNLFVAYECIEDAIYEYKKVLEISPNYIAAHNNLGVLLAQIGEKDEAIYHYNQALLIKPDYSPAYNNLQKLLNQN